MYKAIIAKKKDEDQRRIDGWYAAIGLAKEKKILQLTKNDSGSNHCKVKWLRGVVKIEAVME